MAAAPASGVGSLPDFPWDSLAAAARVARSHPDGIVDLSVGTPVDPTPAVIRDALVAASDAPGYPATYGTPALREAVAAWFRRRRGVPDLDPAGVLPTIGSKELVAWLPVLLGLGATDLVLHPRVAYPTYDVGARMVGATAVPTDDPVSVLTGPDRHRVGLVWLNSPGNPDGSVLDVAAMRAVVTAARAVEAETGRPVVVASDECYAELAWSAPWDRDGVPSILDPRVSGGLHDNLIAVYSLSKQSNLAGYRAAFVAGGTELVGRLLAVRKHLGMMVPMPVQVAMTAALQDDTHVAVQREIYRRRREQLAAAVVAAGGRIDHSDAGLYLWVAAPHGALATVDSLADLGILAAPGTFYGDDTHVRLAVTATDERVAAAAARLAAHPGLLAVDES